MLKKAIAGLLAATLTVGSLAACGSAPASKGTEAKTEAQSKGPGQNQSQEQSQDQTQEQSQDQTQEQNEEPLKIQMTVRLFDQVPDMNLSLIHIL